jgi:regulator of sirC expression with transglutaminase-like and TPR domain
MKEDDPQQIRSELVSLIKLLDDDDEIIYGIAKERLIASGDATLALIAERYGHPDEGILNKRLQEITQEITFTKLKEQFRAFKRKYEGALDLEEGAFLIARIGNPVFDQKPAVEKLNALATELDGRLDHIQEPEDIIRTVNQYFFVDKQFRGNSEDYYNLDSHYINRVLDTKTGVPIALSTIYLLVARRLNIPVYGIGMPAHFIVRYELNNKNIYVDPFHEGRVLKKEDCMEFLLAAGYEFREEYLEPVSTAQIMERMLRNLIVVYERLKSKAQIERLLQYVDILNSNV